MSETSSVRCVHGKTLFFKGSDHVTETPLIDLISSKTSAKEI